GTHLPRSVVEYPASQSSDRWAPASESDTSVRGWVIRSPTASSSAFIRPARNSVSRPSASARSSQASTTSLPVSSARRAMLLPSHPRCSGRPTFSTCTRSHRPRNTANRRAASSALSSSRKVGSAYTAARSECPGQRLELVEGGQAARHRQPAVSHVRLGGGGSEPDGPGRHRLAHDARHLRDLVARRRPVLRGPPHDPLPNGRVAEQGR